MASLSSALRDTRSPPIVACVFGLLAFLPTLRFIWHRADVVRGWEADAIARAIAKGHGFSYSGADRWLWDKWNGNPNEYHPTAWVDPVFTYILAAAHIAFKDQAYLAIYGLKFLCLAGILVGAYKIAKHFYGQWCGALTVVLITANTPLGRAFFDDITNSVLSALAIVLTALAAVKYFEDTSLQRLAALGLLTGFTVLTCPATQYFVPLLAACLFAFHFKNLGKAAARCATVVLLAALVVAPWTIRNYLTFGEFVLVRNGAGQIAWDGVVGPAASFIPDAEQSPLSAPWSADGPREAVHNMLNKDYRLPIHRFQVYALQAAPEPGYHTMNEAQRDELYMNRVKEFIKDYPLATAQMALAKIEVFLTRFGLYGLMVAALAAIGVALALRDARSWPLTLLAVSYSAPFLLAIAYYGRYRAPIEPVLSVLAAIGITRLGLLALQRSRTSGDRKKRDSDLQPA